MKKKSILTYSIILLLFGGFLIFLYFAQGKITGFVMWTGQLGVEGKDTYLRGSSPDENDGVNTLLTIGKNGGNGEKRNHGLIEFNFSDIPVNSTINSAILYLTMNSSTGQVIDIHRFTRSWDEGTGIDTITNNGATWNNATGTLAWTTAGGDFDSFVFASNSTIALNEALTFDITSLVRGWINGTWNNYGFLLKHNNETVNGNDVIYSSDYGDQTFRPKLVINYNSAPSLIVLSPDNGSIYSNNNVSLNFSVSDLENNLDSCWYEFENVNHSISNCMNTSFSISGNGNHSLAVYANDSLNYLNSSSATFTIDTLAPNLTINSPSATTYLVSTILFNATSIDATTLVNSCWYTINSGTTNQTLSKAGTSNSYNFTASSIVDNSYTAKFYCNDSANNVNNTENVAFTIDTSVQDVSSGSSGGSGGGSSKRLNSSTSENLENNKISNTNNFSNHSTNEQFEISLVDVSRRKGFVDAEYLVKNLADKDQNVDLYFSILDFNENIKSEITETHFVPANSEKTFGTTMPLDKNINEELILIIDFKKYSSSVSENAPIRSPISGLAIINAEKNKNNLALTIILSLLSFIFVFFVLYKIIRRRENTK